MQADQSEIGVSAGILAREHLGKKEGEEKKMNREERVKKAKQIIRRYRRVSGVEAEDIRRRAYGVIAGVTARRGTRLIACPPWGALEVSRSTWCCG